jgi:hypothetical protein
MANIFDSANAPLTEPSVIVAGDYVQWWQKDLITDYPTASYSLRYVAKTADNGGGDIVIVATEAADGYLVQVASTVTAEWVYGTYQWQQEIIRTSDSAKIVLKQGQFVVKQPLNATGEARSHAQIMLSKIESVLQGKADADVASYSVAGRSLTKMTFSELMSVRDLYKAEVRREMAQAGIAGTTSTIKVRFT